jgi:4'-phosphopantetheinyl transferase EntD
MKTANSASPATLSIAMAGLFPPGTVVAELRGPGDPAMLLPGEAAHLGRAVLSRAQEFAAGRLCARRALAEFGIAGFGIKVGAGRQPLWPDGLVGSITHTAGYSAAAVAARPGVCAIGIDSEVIGDVNPQIWLSICLEAETNWIRSLPALEQAAAATLIFSAKEAFYKCQYPVAAERVGFHDVSVEPLEWGAGEGGFQIRPLRRLAFSPRVEVPFQGRYRLHEQFLTAAIAVRAG